jgi:hypothetical protein
MDITDPLAPPASRIPAAAVQLLPYDRSNAIYQRAINSTFYHPPGTKSDYMAKGMVLGIAVMLWMHAHDGAMPDKAGMVEIEQTVHDDAHAALLGLADQWTRQNPGLVDAELIGALAELRGKLGGTNAHD